MSIENTINSYYNDPAGLQLTQYSRSGPGSPIVGSLTSALRDTEELDQPEIDERLHEIARGLRVLQHGGSNFEVAVANGDVDSDIVMLHMSTYTSAISNNPGNMHEFAAQAVRYPNARHVYVASFGNGGTSPLLPEDAAYTCKTGRFTIDKGRITVPIRSITNLHGALEAAGLTVTNIMGTDSAGGHYARSLAVAMEEGQLDSAFFSETSGFVDLSVRQIGYGIAVKEQLISSKTNRKLSPDLQQVDALKIAHAKAIYDQYADTDNAQRLRALKVGTFDTARSMYVAMQALRKGPRAPSNPLITDTDALLARHPDARVSYGLAENDPLYLSPEICHVAAMKFLGSLTIQHGLVKTIIVPDLTHAYNTYFPSLYHAVKKEALYGLTA